MSILKRVVKSFYPGYYFLEKNIVELNDYRELHKIFKWKLEPILERPDMYDYDYVEDANGRRVRDTEVLATISRNIDARQLLEIGTSDGQGTVLLATNAPQAKVYTINIPPEEIKKGEGGKLVTYAPSIEQIGIEYKKKGLKNVEQIYANTATWKPDIGELDFVFIDGCHDTEFVINDTLKVLPFVKKGGFILWHDFNLQLHKRYNWINDVCQGIEKLYRRGAIKGNIYHVKDSWIGIYQVTK